MTVLDIEEIAKQEFSNIEEVIKKYPAEIEVQRCEIVENEQENTLCSKISYRLQEFVDGNRHFWQFINLSEE